MKKLKFTMEFKASESDQSEFIQKLKNHLKMMCTELYTEMGEDIPLSREDFIVHYKGLAEILYEIETINSFKEFLAKALQDKFGGVICVDDEEGFADFISRINK